MQTLLKTKIGPFLVISSVLVVWTFLAVQPVQAHTLTNPSCSRLPTAEGFFTDSELGITSGNFSDNNLSTSTKKGTGESGGGNKNYYYAKITVPALTAGELTVSEATATNPSEAILCGRQEGSVSDLPSYTTAHNNAAKDADDATTAQAAAEDAATAAGETDASASTAKAALRSAESALRSAESDLRRAESALRSLESDLRDDGDTSGAEAAKTAADNAETAEMEADDAEKAADTAEKAVTTASDAVAGLGAAADALEAAASVLDAAATALDDDMGFSINVLISSGDEEYVMVVTVPADADAPSLSVDFKGVMATTADTQNGQDGGSFTSPNQRITHTLMTTDKTPATPGLLTVKTTGSTVDTKGTLDTGGNTTAMDEDEDGDGNFEIVSPVKANTAYSVFVDGQTRNEMGDYGLKVEFRVATDLGDDATSDTGITRRPDEIQFGADYFFFTASPNTYRFLTVETEKHDDLTRATNTTGTLFSDKGVVNTDTDGGFGSNFLIRAPISPGDYIVEVKGSTGGKYALSLTSKAATPHMSRIPNMADEIAGDATGTLAERGVNPHSINVAKPGTLQVKTTGDLDTIGVLYGPDGQQIWEDDNSGKDMNFRITQAVEAGQYIVTVEGKAADTMGDYTLVVNFLEDVDLGSEGRVAELTRERDNLRTERNNLRTERDNLRTERDNLRTEVTQLREATAPVTVDATGFLGNPSDGGVRSGVGLISGWVCAANEVEIRIFNAQNNRRVRTLDAAYGTSRPDVPQNSNCTNANAGFGMTYNFNHLPEGEYRIGAYADGTTRIGAEHTFEVVHLVEFSATDTDRFLQGLDGECIVTDFPAAGETTMLEWEQSLQNFVITGVQ